MRVEVQREDQNLRLPPFVKIKDERTTITIIIPDDVLEGKTIDLAPALKESHEMLGADYYYVPSGKTDRQILEDARMEKYSR